MKRISVLILLVGALWIINALAMDISVSSIGGRVANLSLMHERTTNLIVGGFVIFFGLLLRIFKEKLTTPGGRLEKIDGLSQSEYAASLITTVVGTWCIWSAVISYMVPIFTLILLIGGFIGWHALTKDNTYKTTKNIWKIIFIITLIFSLLHGASLIGNFANIATYFLIKHGVELLNTDNIFYIYTAHLIPPLLISTIGLTLSIHKNKTTDNLQKV